MLENGYVKGRPNLTLQQLIEDTYCLDVCTSTVSLWLHDMGFSYKQFSKGVYFDGHEREDVVEERKGEGMILWHAGDVMHQWFLLRQLSAQQLALHYKIHSITPPPPYPQHLTQQITQKMKSLPPCPHPQQLKKTRKVGGGGGGGSSAVEMELQSG